MRLPQGRKRVALLSGLVLMGLAVWLYRKVCPSPTVPSAHFVKSPHNQKVIIFVHGVLGDMDNTWVNPETAASWPQLIAEDSVMQSYDVYVYGYLTRCEGRASNIYEISNRFAQELQDNDFFSKYQEIDFITHSMGGLVTKQMLSSLNNPAGLDKLQRIHAVLFIAVPSAGADLASIASWISSNPQFKNMSREDAQVFLQTIDGAWNTVIRNRDQHHPFPRAFVAYETRDLGLLRVVPPLFTSQVSDLPPLALDYDHVRIVKPESRSSEIYKWANRRILESSGSSASSACDQVISIKEEIDKLTRDFEAVPVSGDIVRERVNQWSPRRAQEMLDIPDEHLRFSCKVGKYEYAAYAFTMAASTDTSVSNRITFADKSIVNGQLVKQFLTAAHESKDSQVSATLDRLISDDTEPRVDYLMAMDYCIKAREERNASWKIKAREILNEIPPHFKEETPPSRNPDLRGCT